MYKVYVENSVVCLIEILYRTYILQEHLKTKGPVNLHQ